MSISNFFPLAPSNCQRHLWTVPILWVWSCSKRLHKSKVIIHKSTTQLNVFLSLLKVHYQISKNFLNILFSLIWCNFLVLTLKVSKSQKQTMAPWILPKKERWGNFRFLEESRTPFFFEIYWPLECLKKNFCPWKLWKTRPQKLLIIGPNFFSVPPTCPNQPKSQFMFHKNCSPLDL